MHLAMWKVKDADCLLLECVDEMVKSDMEDNSARKVPLEPWR